MSNRLHHYRSPGQIVRQLAALYRMTAAHYLQLAKDQTDQGSRAYYLRARHCAAVTRYLENLLQTPAGRPFISEYEVRALIHRLKRIHRIHY